MSGSVSVVIPAYNSAQWLPDTLQSCLDQAPYVKEIIVVDDHSQDSSWDLLTEWQEKYPDLIRIFKNKKKGGNHARNFGFSKAKGDYIQWLDSDDILVKGKLEAQVGYFEAHPEVDVVYSDFQLLTYDDEGNVTRTEDFVKDHYEDFLFELLKDNWGPPHIYLHRKKTARKAFINNAWNPNTPVLQDREYITMVAIHGAKFGYVPGMYSLYNRWRTSRVSNAKLGLRNESLFNLCYHFKQEIAYQDWISDEKKQLYYSQLNTQIVYACALNNKLKLKKPKPKMQQMMWDQVKGGIRTKLKMRLKLLF